MTCQLFRPPLSFRLFDPIVSDKADTVLWSFGSRIGNCIRGTLLAWIAPLLPSIISEIQEGQHLIEVR